MAFDEGQKQAIRHKEGPAIVLAGPGSGKTTVITNRIRYLTEKAGVDPSGILVITFTRAAAISIRLFLPIRQPFPSGSVRNGSCCL